MLAFFRRGCAAWVATCVLVASLALPVSASWHLMPDDDAACVPSGVPGHPVAQLEVVRTGPAAEHCALCHWMRALGGAALGHHTATAAWLSPGEISLAISPAPTPQQILSLRPSRAPPASSL